MIKVRALYILLVVAGLSSCIKEPKADGPVAAPQGSFTGQFIKEHRNSLTNARDTVKTTVQLVLNGNKYKVTDATGVHANSRGLFGFNTAYATWSDSTATNGSNLNSPPYHLNGSYAYAVTDNELRMEAYNDTLKYTYLLKKQ